MTDQNMALDYDQLAQKFARLALRAGQKILAFYHAPDQSVRVKADLSPLTDADEQAEAVITQGLTKLLPDVPIIAEEAVARGQRPSHAALFLLVDALDGTREFINRNGEFTVNIALIKNGQPVCGVVYAPALKQIWYSGTQAFTARVDPSHDDLPISGQPLRCRPAPAQLVALTSRSHQDPRTSAYLKTLPLRSIETLGSSLKMCRIAEGRADVYPRFSPTMEWDIAAGHAILMASGGAVVGCDGKNLAYGKHDLHNPPFICWGDQAMINKLF